MVDDHVLRSPSRLRAVADLGLLDTPDEQPFDRWALRALDLATASVALVSLVDDTRSFFKTFRLRDGTAGAQREVPISMSLCREVVVRGESLIVADALRDLRTRDYGAVRAFPVGAYAGMPLRSADGHVLGSFCVVDSDPRKWADEQLAGLADIHAAVQAELRLRATSSHAQRDAALLERLKGDRAEMLVGAARSDAALSASERQLRQILETAHDAFVAIDATGSITDWNPRAETIFGWSRTEAIGRDIADTIIPAEYRDAHRRALQRLVAGGETQLQGRLLELSAIHRDGHEFPVELTISPVATDDGYSYNAFVRDITERRRAQEELGRARDLAVSHDSMTRSSP